jgi:hypothetical protein
MIYDLNRIATEGSAQDLVIINIFYKFIKRFKKVFSKAYLNIIISPFNFKFNRTTISLLGGIIVFILGWVLKSCQGHLA